MDNSELRQELIKLSELKEIKQSRKFLEKAPEGTLVAIMEKYEREKLDQRGQRIGHRTSPYTHVQHSLLVRSG